MYPHERSLVKRLEGKPFVLLGVNSDPDREALNKVVNKEQLTWRSWWDGRDGPIARQWNVTAWPTLYVIDARGVIRYRDVFGKDLDAAVDSVLRERKAERREKPQSR